MKTILNIAQRNFYNVNYIPFEVKIAQSATEGECKYYKRGFEMELYALGKTNSPSVRRVRAQRTISSGKNLLKKCGQFLTLEEKQKIAAGIQEAEDVLKGLNKKPKNAQEFAESITGFMQDFPDEARKKLGRFYEPVKIISKAVIAGTLADAATKATLAATGAVWGVKGAEAILAWALKQLTYNYY